MQNKAIWYKLSGKSLDAAKRLEALVGHEFSKLNVSAIGKNGLEIMTERNAFSENFLETLKKTDPALLKATGLADPSVRVNRTPGENPRVYLEYPEIYSTPVRNPDY